MGFKKRNKVSAQFNMSSLTDIIFLLLIFFMLTSTLVAPNSLNLKLPGSSQKKVESTRNLDEVQITGRGQFKINGSAKTVGELERFMKNKAGGRTPNSVSIIISPDKNAKVEHVVTVMDMAMRYDINGVLAPEK